MDVVELIQWRAVCWAHGAYGIISVMALLCNLGWLSLVDRRQII
jgi:hypothetical protein